MFVKVQALNHLVNLDAAKEIYTSADTLSNYVIRVCYTDGAEIDIVYSKSYAFIAERFNELIKKIQAGEMYCILS